MASPSNSPAAARRPTFPICSKGCSAAGGAAAAAAGRSAASAGAAPRRRKGPDVGYRLDVAFEDAAALKGQRVTLSSGKTLDIKLPQGVEDGAKIRLAGQGQAGPGGNGDAIVTIAIRPHRFFRREGDNIRLELPITLDEAVNGAKVRVPTVDGPVMVSVPKGSSSGKTLRLKGKGFTAKGGQRGDQLVTLMIDLPPDDARSGRLRRGLEGSAQRPGRAGRLKSR